jgi:hypothetical protein
MRSWRFLRRRTSARYSVLVTIVVVVFISGTAAAALLLWPTEDEFGFSGSWKNTDAASTAVPIIDIELRDGGWQVTGVLIDGKRVHPAHLEGHTLVVDDGAGAVRFRVDVAQDHLTMITRSAGAEHVDDFVRVQSGL